MKKPKIIVRRGDRFVIDESKLLPSLRSRRDMVNSAVAIACQHYKDYPDQYRFLSPEARIDKLNEVLYTVLEQWGIYKERK